MLLGVVEPRAREVVALERAEDVPRVDARPHARREVRGAVDAARSRDRRARSPRASDRTRRTAAARPSSHDASSLVSRWSTSASVDRARVVARRRLELAGLEPPLAAPARSTSRPSRGRPPRRGASRCRAACSDAPSPSTFSSACPAAACISRAASWRERVDDDLADNRRREAELARPGVATKSRSFSAASDRSSAVIGLPEHLGRTATSTGSPSTAAAWRVPRSARASRATRDATRPRSVFGSARSCPTSFIVTTLPSATVTARASTRALITSSMNSGCPPARVARRSARARRAPLDPEAHRDEALDVAPASRSPSSRRRVRAELLERVGEPGARREDEDDAHVA